MKAIGTNTDSSTSVNRDDRRGDLRHGLFGSFGGRRVRLFLHHALDVLDTTMASSTTMPMASTIASSDTVLAE